MNKPQWNGTKWIDAEPLPIIPPNPTKPTEYEALRAEIDFEKMIRETQQSEIDYLKLMGGM